MRTAVVFLLGLLVPAIAQAQTIARWVQVGPDGIAELRTVETGPSCPELAVDGRTVGLHVRAEADAHFPKLCAIALPSGAKHISLGAETVEAPVSAPRRIAVLGDTGCRIAGGMIQDCNDPMEWPFWRVAKAIAKLKPDLVLHVGDYLYRESPCPKGRSAGCGSSPYGDNWSTWEADFFAPAKPLLESAPIVFVRGNHEDCNRAGLGWLRLMGPAGFDPAAPCTAHLPPYAVPLGGVNLVVLDDADAPDKMVDTTAREVYRAEFRALASLAPAPIWLALHRPIAGAVRLFGFTFGGNRTLIASLDDDSVLAPVTLMLSGHIHTFEAINYDGNRPPQLVAGNGGDKLDTASASLANTNLGTWHVKDGLSLPGFGFLLLARHETDWQVEVYGADGAIKRICVFAARRLDCPAK